MENELPQLLLTLNVTWHPSIKRISVIFFQKLNKGNKFKTFNNCKIYHTLTTGLKVKLKSLSQDRVKKLFQEPFKKITGSIKPNTGTV